MHLIRTQLKVYTLLKVLQSLQYIIHICERDQVTSFFSVSLKITSSFSLIANIDLNIGGDLEAKLARTFYL